MDLLSTAERSILRRVANDTSDTKAKIKGLISSDLSTLETAAYDVWILARDEGLYRKEATRRAREALAASRQSNATEPGKVTV